LPITALRETPIAAAIWLQVMPLPTHARSCSMRSGVQVAFDGAILLPAGATIAESSAGAEDAIGGSAGDEIVSDGAIDGDMERPRLLPRPVWAAGQGVCPRAAGNRETASLEAKIGARLESRSRKRCPRRWWRRFAEKVSPTKQLCRIHRAASRLKDGKPAVGVAPVRRTLIGAASCRC
jgi:hypothetical protein